MFVANQRQDCEYKNIVYLNESAALPEPRLPCVAEVLHFCDESVMLNVESQLAHLVPAEHELLSGGPRRHRLQTLSYLAHVFRLPVFGVQNQCLALKNYVLINL